MKVVGVKLRGDKRIYKFATDDAEIKEGDYVVVTLEKGPALGQITEVLNLSIDAPLPFIERKATEKDLVQNAKNAALEKTAFHFCLERIQAHGLEMKLIRVECLFDRSKIIFYYTADGRVDFRELLKDLVKRFRMRIELRQIGVRNETQMLGGLGPCGRELCCSLFLKQFAPVSVKMAKEQYVSLNPEKISGICGRLMCCLSYECPLYQEFKKGLPEAGEEVKIGELKGKVLRYNLPRQSVYIETDDHQEIELPITKFKNELIREEA